MSGLVNWRSNTLNQQRQQQNMQLNQQYLVVQQQRVQQQQQKLQDNYNTLNTTLLNPNNRTLTINGQSSITCDILTVTGGNNQIVTTVLTGVNAPVPQMSVIGYFQWNYGTIPVTNVPTTVNTAVAFTGWANPATALSQSLSVYGGLQGNNKYISLGGGQGANGTCSAGAFTRAILNSIYTAINAGNFSNYTGILFDIEYVLGSGLYTPSGTNTYDSFQQVFAAAKVKKLMVIVCVGHSGNIGITDSTYSVSGLQPDTTLLPSCLTDPNVDFVSPQLYSSGSEDPPQYNVNGLPWSQWASSSKPIIVAIPWAQQYSQVLIWAQTQGLTLSGFLQWNNTNYPGGPVSGPAVTINITNSTKELLNIGSTLVNANGGTYTTKLAIPFTLGTTFNTTPFVNGANISCSASELDINFGYGNSGVLTNILATGTFNGTSFSVGKNPVSSNKIGNAPTQDATNVLHVTFTDV